MFVFMKLRRIDGKCNKQKEKKKKIEPNEQQPTKHKIHLI